MPFQWTFLLTSDGGVCNANGLVNDFGPNAIATDNCDP
jgi:hypothetical protein